MILPSLSMWQPTEVSLLSIIQSYLRSPNMRALPSTSGIFFSSSCMSSLRAAMSSFFSLLFPSRNRCEERASCWTEPLCGGVGVVDGEWWLDRHWFWCKVTVIIKKISIITNGQPEPSTLGQCHHVRSYTGQQPITSMFATAQSKHLWGTAAFIRSDSTGVTPWSLDHQRGPYTPICAGY
jgi:hypothetical protein